MSPDKPNDKPDADTPQPVDLIDGIPDRAARRPVWKYIALGVVFGLWVAFLIYCALVD